jgi:hypothetical protein
MTAFWAMKGNIWCFNNGGFTRFLLVLSVPQVCTVIHECYFVDLLFTYTNVTHVCNEIVSAHILLIWINVLSVYDRRGSCNFPLHIATYLCLINLYLETKIKLNSVACVRERTMPIERPPLVGEVSANFCGYRVLRGQHSRSLRRILGFLERSR